MNSDSKIEDAPREKKDLWNRNFSILWIGLIQSALGDAFLTIGLMWLILEETGSPLAASTLLILQGFPKVFGPLAGVIVDRNNKKLLLIGCDVLRGVFLIVLFALYQSDLLHIHFLFFVAALEGALSLFYSPSLRVILPTLVDDDKLPAANSLLQGGQHMALIIGAALAGVSLATIGAPLALLIDGITFLLAAIAISTVKLSAAMTRSEKTTFREIKKDLIEGLKFLFFATEMVLLTVIVFTSNFILSPVNIVFPIFSREVLGEGVRGFGFLTSAVAVGLLLGSIVAGGIIGDRLSYRWAILGGLAGLGLALVALSLTQSLLPAAIIAGSLGMIGPIIQVPLVSYLQRSVPQRLQGRVFATMNSLVSLATPLGAAIFGMMLERIEVPQIFRWASAGCLGVAMLWWVVGILRGVTTSGPPSEEAEASAVK